jgi:archaemetzincin
VRAAKVTLHELGHLLDVFHCDDPMCLMHFSGGLSELDDLPMQFCRYCRRYVKEAVATAQQQ